MILPRVRLDPDTTTLRQFGATGSILLLAWLAQRAIVGSFDSIALGYWIALLALVILTVLVPRTLRFPFIVASAVTLPIGFVLGHVIFAAFYFLVLTPLGVTLRLAGKLSIVTANQRTNETYLVTRPPSRRSFFRQY